MHKTMMKVVNENLKHDGHDDPMQVINFLVLGIVEHFKEVANILDIVGQVSCIIYGIMAVA